jgi:hypothetical protein
MASVSGIVRDAHRLRGTGGNASRGNDEAQRLVLESRLVAAGAVVISSLKIPSENKAFNPSDLPRIKPNDKTLKRMDK